jgi:hypothetical protein
MGLPENRRATTRDASDTSIKATLEPVKLFEGIGNKRCTVGRPFAV